MSEFCPQCRSTRVGALRFCRGCGFDFDTAPVPTTTLPDQSGAYQRHPLADPAPLVVPATPATSVTPTSNLPVMAGIAWLITAALTGYLAYQQWTYSQQFSDSSDLQLAAAWNGLACAVTLYFAARHIASPSRRLLDGSAAWAILSVVGGIIQIEGPSPDGDVFAASVIGAAVAGILSFVGRQQYPRHPSPITPDPGLSATSSTGAASVAAPVAPRRSGFGRAEVLVVLLIVGAVAVGGYLLLGNRSAPPGVATATPTVAAARVTEECRSMFAPLYDKLTEIDGKLGIGLNFAEYGDIVGEANVAYGRLPEGSQIPAPCVTSVGVPLENALNAYITAYQSWSECVEDSECDDDANTTILRGHWSRASSEIGKVRTALR